MKVYIGSVENTPESYDTSVLKVSRNFDDVLSVMLEELSFRLNDKDNYMYEGSGFEEI